MSPSAASQKSSDAVLAELVEEFTNRLQAGEPVDVESYIEKHPEHAERLRPLLPALALLDDLGRSVSAVAGGSSEALEGNLSGVLGDFRILREVGKGGMGVVYEAEQISLRRRVALKVLPFAATMDSRHLQRFHNEAQAAACLHHTNIVPVHFVGSERGVHFYAMQFIDGQPLSELIRQLRQAEKPESAAESEPTVAYQLPPDDAIAASPATRPVAEVTPLTSEGRRGRDYYRKVAEMGIQAAEALDHAHQLGIVHRDIKPGNLMLDGTGRLWVTDFGLARMQHGETSLTGTGQMVGTPRYMSPEQALAERVPIDHRTDVYSLGVTLYEMLTLRPAFMCEERHELLRQIAFEEPAKPWRLERTIPAELEIIVLKAMEKRPRDRYATAQEMADDLERWLRHEPIRARRPTLLQRAAKWVRRHKPAATASALVLLMALMMAGYAAWTRHDRVARREASEKVILAALKDSQEQQEQRRLPEALSSARRADGLLAGADVEESLRQKARARLADLELLEKLENVRLEQMTAVKEGHFDEAGGDALYGQVFRDAGLDVEGLPVEEAGACIRRTTVAAELASVLDHWASTRRNIGGLNSPSWQALLQVARLADPDAWGTRVREALEIRDRQALMELATSKELFDRPVATLSVLGSALLEEKRASAQIEAFLREAQRRHPNDFWLSYNLYRFHYTTMQPPQLEDAHRLAAVVVSLRPRNPAVHHNLGLVLQDKGRLEEAIAEIREAISLKKDYAEAHANLGYVLRKTGQLDEGIEECREAIRLKKDSVEAHNILGNLLRDSDQLDEAIAEFREAVRLKKEDSRFHSNLGCTLVSKGQLEEGIAEFREAIRLNKDDAAAHTNLGDALRHRGQLDEAIAECREAIRLKKEDVEAHTNLGNALKDKGQLDEAIAEYREAIRLKKDYPMAHSNLGVALQSKGRLDEAIAEFREAIRLNKDFAEAYNNLGAALCDVKRDYDGAILAFRECIRLKKDFADGHFNLGNALHHKGQIDEAIDAYREAIRLKKDYAVAYCYLGGLFQGKGQFTEALGFFRRGHELGSKHPLWRLPSAQWVRTCEYLVELDGKLPAILSGKKQPVDNAERLALARLCHLPCKKQNLAAMRFYSAAFDENPKLADDLNAQHRYNAASAAVLAGYGQGADLDKLDAKERARLRQQALDWLRADLTAYAQVLEKSAGKAGPAITQRMQHWLQDNDFAGLRGTQALAKLPEAERKDWHKLWEGVETMRQRAAKQPKTESSPRP